VIWLVALAAGCVEATNVVQCRDDAPCPDGRACIDGVCAEEGAGGAGGCAARNDACGATADCCAGFFCDQGDCRDLKDAGDECVLDEECREGLACVGGKCTTLTVGSMQEGFCALRGGELKCWGRNTAGQLGLGNTQSRGGSPGQMGSNLPLVDPGAPATGLARGSSAQCAILGGGALKCWGLNDQGQLGLGDKNNRGDAPGEMGDALPTVDLGTGRTARRLHASWFTSCALLDDGNLKCWGASNYGQVGNGQTADVGDSPGEMGDKLPAVQIF